MTRPKLMTGEAMPGEATLARKDRPRVFLMADSFQFGGTERQFAAIAQALHPEQFEVSLGCLKQEGSFLEGLGEVSEFNPGGSFFGVQAQRTRLALGRRLRAAGIAVAHAFDFYSNMMLLPVARLVGVRAVVGSHRQIGDLLTPRQFYAQQIAFQLCDRVVCNSRAAASRLTARGLPERKIVVIPNGLPESAFAETKPSLPLSPGTLRIALIARMNHAVKNHAGFLRAAALIAQKYPGVEFLLIGDGALRPQLEALAAELGLQQRVRFLGERKDIAALLAGTEISVVNSTSESLSNAALESMAAGVPVVATRVGGNPEIVRDGETGLLVRPGNEQELANALELLITRPSLRGRLSRSVKNFAMATFRMKSVIRQYEELYAEILAKKNWNPQKKKTHPVGQPGSHDRLRVAIVAASLRYVGGQSAQAEQLMRRWEKDPEIEARFIPIDPQFPRGLQWMERIPFLRTAMRMPFYLSSLWAGIKNADIVHIFSASYWSFLVAPLPAWLVARMKKKKALIHYHSGEAQDHLRRSAMALKVLRATDGLIVPSAYLKEVFKEFGVKAGVVPNFPDLTRFSYRSRPYIRPLLLNTRGFHNYYAIDQVIRAFEQVQKSFPESRLCLVGKGSLEGEIRKLSSGLNGIEFTGPADRETVSHFYDQNDIFINASWLDNVPVSILEAFASGLPVVTTAAGGIRYMVEHEHTGLLCSPGDWQTLAENVCRLLLDPTFALYLARNAWEEAERYRWENVRSLWMQVYQSMCPPTNKGRIASRFSSVPAVNSEILNLIEKELPEKPAV